MKKAAFYTLGCKVNQYETEAMTEIFKEAGYEIVDFESIADVYVINTCTVTGLSARKSRQMIRRAKTVNENAVIAVAGCYSQTAPEEVESIPGVDVVIGTKDRGRIFELIREFEANGAQINVVADISHDREFEELHVDNHQSRTRAYLKVQDGCSQFCAYCIIPYARGPIRSRPVEDVLNEVGKLAENGFKEVVLTGIHLASYGKDFKGVALIDLVKEIHKVEGIERIRLGSVEPGTITEEFVDEARKLEKLCPHYHISLQSGCDATLKRMNRKYDTAFYRRAVALLRSNISDVAITTDIMAGFPGETEEEFLQTLDFVEGIGFAKMHVFKFSPRKGTPAASFADQVDGSVKEHRSNLLMELSNRMGFEFNSGFIGRELPVLFEQEAQGFNPAEADLEMAVLDEEKCECGADIKKCEDGGRWYEGLTTSYTKVYYKSCGDLKGCIANVRILKAEADFLLAEG
ncbi:MAG: tRNA (N(6)-L-threonylcarbamoyladenosine(37)-C(2))-methylthiotransferase MtaB [Clostridiales bacterium]|nr:tRNA (N(6)-L-threonylcarbamoyladenosine(37)-C(2))-methylthiotransferase MtaB [Clostridiales bacterium]